MTTCNCFLNRQSKASYVHTVIDSRRSCVRVTVVVLCVSVCVFVHQMELVDITVNQGWHGFGNIQVFDSWILLKIQCSKGMVFSSFTFAIHLTIVASVRHTQSPLLPLGANVLAVVV